MKFYYNPFSAPSRAVWMTLGALEVEYEAIFMNLLKGEHRTAEYKAINPRCKVPAIKNGNICVAESRAVAAYLVNEFGDKQAKRGLYPTDPAQRAAVDQQLFVDENLWEAILSYLNVPGIFFKGEGHKTENLDKAKAAIKYYDDLLSKHTYVATDNLTIADFFAINGINLMRLSGFNDFREYPHIARWLKLIEALPYYAKTCEIPWIGHKKALDMKKNTNGKT